MDSIQLVQSLYERYPYPNYPLLAKPIWQDGYLGASAFARTLAGGTGSAGDFLSIGCGEILPYVIRKWESSNTHLVFNDLSRRSLRRAKFRLIGKRADFVAGDINAFLQTTNETFDHVEAYGVLHHIANVRTTLNGIVGCMAPGATMRVMVYNTDARNWIWEINRGLRLLGIHYGAKNSFAVGRNILAALAIKNSHFAERLKQLGTSTLENESRFADTFLHPFEISWDVSTWLREFQNFGLTPYALFDRYAELDDLANPLWQIPSAKDLQARCHDRRFEGNLEIWLRHGDVSRESKPTKIPRSAVLRRPRYWFQYEETKNIPSPIRLQLWQHWLRTLQGETRSFALKKLLPHVSNTAWQRLSRVGAIFKEDAEDLGIYKKLLSPMAKSMDAPTRINNLKSECLTPEFLRSCGVDIQDARCLDYAVLRFRRAFSK
jgi:2-polyprenyl-3-methyl-5-hydroxy-6-metoxy-1,4-benzoquinol methylase